MVAHSFQNCFFNHLLFTAKNILNSLYLSHSSVACHFMAFTLVLLALVTLWDSRPALFKFIKKLIITILSYSSDLRWTFPQCVKTFPTTGVQHVSLATHVKDFSEDKKHLCICHYYIVKNIVQYSIPAIQFNKYCLFWYIKQLRLKTTFLQGLTKFFGPNNTIHVILHGCCM